MDIEECTSSAEWFRIHGPHSMPFGGFRRIAENRRRLGDQSAQDTARAHERDERLASFRAELAIVDRARAIGIPAPDAARLAREHATEEQLQAAADQLVPERAFRILADQFYARQSGA